MTSNLALPYVSTASPNASPAWRQFPFFDDAHVKDVHDLDKPPEIFKAASEISTITSSSRGVLVADTHGSIHFLNKDFEPIISWVAHMSGRVTHMIERKGVLVTLGEEDAIAVPILMVWDLQNRNKKTGGPLLLRSTKVQLSNRPHPVTTIALSASLSHLAIGLGDGTVLLYRHLDQSLASSHSMTSFPKLRTVHESPTEPITGLGFKEPTEDAPDVTLFIVTTHRILSYQVSGKGSGGATTVVDEVGAGLGGATMDTQAKNIIVGREEAIYVCGVDGRGACYAYEGNKSSIHAHLNYLVIVSPPITPAASSVSATVSNIAVRNADAEETDSTKVTVFDPENKLIAYSGTVREGVRQIFSQWGNVYVLTMDGKLLCLQERSTTSKLDMLYHRSLFQVALNLAKTQNLDGASVADIHRQYGDHMYSKGDYDSAMQQFVRTIGYLQPSYVIRKFLDAQRIYNLVTYLQELHSLGLANSDHTTLLLNTYTKLKDVARLDSFIKTESRRNDTDELPFDLDTAIRVCRQAGYFEHAAYLAEKYERHEDYIKIQIEDAKNYKNALTYLRKLGADAAESNLARYGRALLQNLPHETTQLLIGLCTDMDSLSADAEDTSTAVVKPAAAPSYLSYLALSRNSAAAQTTAVIGSASPPSSSVKIAKQAPHSRQPSTDEMLQASSPGVEGPASPSTPKHLSPRLYFAHFVDHLEQLVIFLESVAWRRWGQSVADTAPDRPVTTLAPVETTDDERVEQVAVWNTLLELYLTLPGPRKTEANTDEEAAMREKAMRVLRGGHATPHDATHALMLCSTHGFTRGLVLLWERMGMYEDVVRFWMDQAHADRGSDGGAAASARVVECLMLYGPEHPHLYPLVLRFLISTPELLARHKEDLKGLLEHIDEAGIMTPLAVIRALTMNDVTSIGLVKEWLVSRLNRAASEIQADKELTDSYRMETAAKLKQVETLSSPEHPHVFHVTRCSACGGQLDLPSVHFMCNHSYHQRCVAEHEMECQKCAREHAVIREIQANNARLVGRHDVFLGEVREDGYAAIAAAFSRGVLNTGGVREGG